MRVISIGRMTKYTAKPLRAVFCGKCGNPISGYGRLGLCRECAAGQKLKLTPVGEKVETIRASVIAGIREHFRQYGPHPHCAKCKFTCFQYYAPQSEIIFCPRSN